MSHPRETGKDPTFLGLDGLAAPLLLILLYSPESIEMWVLVACMIVFLFTLRTRRYSLAAALRRVRCLLVGPHRPRRLGRARPRLGP